MAGTFFKVHVSRSESDAVYVYSSDGRKPDLDEALEAAGDEWDEVDDIEPVEEGEVPKGFAWHLQKKCAYSEAKELEDEEPYAWQRSIVDQWAHEDAQKELKIPTFDRQWWDEERSYL